VGSTPSTRTCTWRCIVWHLGARRGGYRRSGRGGGASRSLRVDWGKVPVSWMKAEKCEWAAIRHPLAARGPGPPPPFIGQGEAVLQSYPRERRRPPGRAPLSGERSGRLPTAATSPGQALGGDGGAHGELGIREHLFSFFCFLLFFSQRLFTQQFPPKFWFKFSKLSLHFFLENFLKVSLQSFVSGFGSRFLWKKFLFQSFW
jgi:hypothetical protein